MVDSIGKMPVGRSAMSGRKRKSVKAKTIKRIEQWRDKARTNILEQRRRYKAKVERNEKQMAEKKEGWEKSLNPSAFSLMSKSRNRCRITHSTVPPRPRYSKVKQKKEFMVINGKNWRKNARQSKSQN